jgi:hypothetical protein
LTKAKRTPRPPVAGSGSPPLPIYLAFDYDNVTGTQPGRDMLFLHNFSHDQPGILAPLRVELFASLVRRRPPARETREGRFND